MIDILGAVYDFVLEYAWRNNDCPRLQPDQIIRGWQNTGTLPQGTPEFCVLTLKNSVAHGKPSSLPIKDDYEYHEQYGKYVEHAVQVDFCGSEPFQAAQLTKLRADLIQMLAFTPEATEFFQRIDKSLTCLYAENVSEFSFLDADKLYTSRYMTTLHLGEIQYSNFIEKQSFNAVRIWTGYSAVENVLEHHHRED